MYRVSFVNTMEDFLEHTQIISLLKDQMEYIGSPKTVEEISETIKLVFKNESSRLMVISDNGHILGFAFFNICVGMESAGKYLWLNEMHIHKNYRSKGYGAILYNAMKVWCNENGIKKIMGMATAADERTINFYSQQGAEVFSQNIISMKI